MLRRTLLSLFLAALAATSALPTYAQEWPTKPIKLVVGYPPGGPVDTLARMLLPRISRELGQPVVVDNRPGAAGATGINAVILGEPDGYTFGIGVLGVLAVLPHTGKPPFKTEEVNYVTLLTKSPHVLVSGKTTGFESLQALTGAARQKPGRLNYGTPGAGSSTHLAGELFEQEAKVEMVHIPYRGGAPVMNALMAGEVEMASVEISAVLPLRAKLNPLAVLSEKRSPLLPEVPTSAELGMPKLVSHSIYGVIAPNRTSAAIVEKFRAAVIAALTAPEVKTRIESQGQLVIPSTPAEYRKYMLDESGKWGALIKTRDIRME